MSQQPKASHRVAVLECAAEAFVVPATNTALRPIGIVETRGAMRIRLRPDALLQSTKSDALLQSTRDYQTRNHQAGKRRAERAPVISIELRCYARGASLSFCSGASSRAFAKIKCPCLNARRPQ